MKSFNVNTSAGAVQCEAHVGLVFINGASLLPHEAVQMAATINDAAFAANNMASEAVEALVGMSGGVDRMSLARAAGVQ